MNAEVHESGCRFQFDYSKVYWNSRLQGANRLFLLFFICGKSLTSDDSYLGEHDRLLKQLTPDDILCDMFAGVGPFAVPAAKKGLTVYGNDLNPDSYEAMKVNAKLNKVEERLTCSNMDAREFVAKLAREGTRFTQVRHCSVDKDLFCCSSFLTSGLHESPRLRGGVHGCLSHYLQRLSASDATDPLLLLHQGSGSMR